ncbi:MAG: L,D-transpeptidase family protein [Acidimicrobiales bacterium]
MDGTSAAVIVLTALVKGGGDDVVVLVVVEEAVLVVVIVPRWAAAESAVAAVRAVGGDVQAAAASARKHSTVRARERTGRDVSGRCRRLASRVAPLAAALALAGCTTTGIAAPAHRHPAALTPSTSTTTLVVTTTVPATVAPPPTTQASPQPPAPHVSPAPTDIAGQEVVVSASGYGATTATLTAYQRTTAGWRVAYGPWTAYVGYDGFAPPGAKREGDGRTPSGTYGFGFAFGVESDPGVHLAYRQVTGPNIVWDDDPSSALYNQWVDTNTANAGADPEPMDNTPAYDHGAVIAYNMDPVVAGAGSAIFLHVSTGGPTAGCVSLPMGELLDVLRWLDPAQQPLTVMGVGAPAP